MQAEMSAVRPVHDRIGRLLFLVVVVAVDEGFSEAFTQLARCAEVAELEQNLRDLAAEWPLARASA